MEKTLDREVIDDQDRISQLPEHLKHHILTSLPTIDAAATSILSSSWKDLWLIQPCFRFDQNFFNKIIQNHPQITDEQLLNILDYIFTKRSKFAHDHKCDAMLDELIFDFPNSSAYTFSLYITHRAITEFKVKKLDLCAIDEIINLNLVKNPTSRSKTNRKMTHLSLRGMTISTCIEARCHGLKVLSLDRIEIDQSVLDILISNCALLKSLELIDCSGEFDTLNVSCHKRLVNLYIKVTEYSSAIENIVIDAPNLQHFVFHDESEEDDVSCAIIDDLALSKGLKSLDIKNVKIPDEWLSHLVAKLTKLTRLTWHEYSLGRVRISSSSLRIIDLASYEQLEELRITDTPNLQEFMYKCK